MRIATVLPYKENYSSREAGAVSLWVKDFLKYSKFIDSNIIYGSTSYKDYLSKNYKNIKIKSINSKLISSTKEYSNKLINSLKKENFDIIELHNRPIMVDDFVKNIESKIILYFHNDPSSMKGAKTAQERIDLLKKVDKIIFISNWVKNKFFENTNLNNHSKTEIIYHSIDPSQKVIKKSKQIVFVGKLNEAKGYDIFCDAINRIMDKTPKWKAFSIGDEKRFKYYPKHKRHINLGYLPHNKVLDFLNKSEIAVIPSRWEEPFGRTALEASSRGCATIISNRGGLPETTNEAIILRKLDSITLKNTILKLIKDNKRRKMIQRKSRLNIKHLLKQNSFKIDQMRTALFPFFYSNTNNNKLRILNIYNLGQKLNHRIYHISIGKKFTNGFIRNGHDVIEISDRDFIRQNRNLNIFNIKDKFQKYLLETFKNYNPDLIIFGHSQNIDTETLSNFRNLNKNLLISQWNEDPMMNGLADSMYNIEKIKNFFPYIDHTFITTHPNLLKKHLSTNNIHYFLTPVDRNIECFDVYNLNPKNDIFYAMSHGVNRATLKKGKIDQRSNFLKSLKKHLKNLNCDFYGFDNIEPIWGSLYFNALINSKMGLNLSRGKPTKYYSSNRIASLMGNGLLTFIDKKTNFNNFFNNDEIVFYESLLDLVDKVRFYNKNDYLRIKIAKKGQKKYFDNFNESEISKYIVDKSIGKLNNLFQ